MTKKNNYVILLLILTLISGCMVEVKDENDASTRDIKKVKTEPEICFDNFKNFCLAKDWENAYNLLSIGWKNNSTLEYFKNNMEKEAIKHFENAFVINITNKQVLNNKVSELTVVHKNGKDVYRFILENNNWKLDGIVILYMGIKDGE